MTTIHQGDPMDTIPLVGCGTCLEYAERRLPTVMRVWFEETGRKTHVGSFLAGVHRRHLAGLPVLADLSEPLGARVMRAALHSPPPWRIGQALFNALYDLNPKLADEIRGTDCDPFHDNDRAAAFMERIADTEASR